ncbi:MAG: hypothetical protein ACYCX8_08115, partial [Acidimicrobiales bacterium]
MPIKSDTAAGRTVTADEAGSPLPLCFLAVRRPQPRTVHRQAKGCLGYAIDPGATDPSVRSRVPLEVRPNESWSCQPDEPEPVTVILV